MTDDRRERYARALHAISKWAGPWPWSEMEGNQRAEWYPDAEAAMAVADAEIAQVNGNLKQVLDGQAAENARLRSELKGTQSAYDTACAENARLRAELRERIAKDYYQVSRPTPYNPVPRAHIHTRVVALDDMDQPLDYYICGICGAPRP